MELSNEDLLRLNVLLANDIEAIRIDESSMTVYGLSRGSEARVPLNPNCRPQQYLRRVREMLSSHVLGSPGGYPVFLQRWTRMGQTRDAQLHKLLLLGEPEAAKTSLLKGLGVATVRHPSSTEMGSTRCFMAKECIIFGVYSI